MNHKVKVKLARKITGKVTGHFTHPIWWLRRESIAKKVAFHIEKSQQNSIRRNIVK